MKATMKSIFSKKAFVLCMHVLTFQFFAAGAHALPVPDTSFGTNGVALIRGLSGTEDLPTTSVLQSDGKLLVAGYNYGRYSHGFVLRLLAGGGLDTTFGQGGFVYLPPSFSGSQQLEQDANGQILVTGMRFTAAGVLDTSFDTQAWGTAARFVQQPDGGLLIVSDATQGAQFALRFVRLDRSGNRDLGFAPNGEKILTGLPANFVMAPGNSVAAEPDGGFTVLAVDSQFNNNTSFYRHDYLLLRLTAAGALNSSFGTGGLASSNDLGNPLDHPFEIVRTVDGKLLLNGYVTKPNVPETNKVVLWRVTAGGIVDASFGTAGRHEVESSHIRSYNYRLAALPNAGIALLETSLISYYPEYSGVPDTSRLMRFDASGAPDNAFGIAGSASITLSGYGGFAAIGVVPNNAGGFLIPGAAVLAKGCSSGGSCSRTGVDLAVADLDSTGRLQPGYGRGDGFAIWSNFENSYEQIDTILVEPAGKVVLAGISNEGVSTSYTNTLVARLMADGSPDSAFGTNGRSAFKRSALPNSVVRAVEQDSGAITVVAGIQRFSSTAFRLDSMGVVDPGYTNTLTGPSQQGAHIALGLRPDGRMLYGTVTYDPNTLKQVAILEQRMPDGARDTSFGVNGGVTFPLDADEYSCGYADLRVLADGAVVFAVCTTMYTANGATGWLRIFKLDTQGRPVVSFGVDGQFGYAVGVSTGLSTGLSLLSFADGSLLASVGRETPATDTVPRSSSLLAIRIFANGVLTSASTILSENFNDQGLSWCLTALPDASVLITRSHRDSLNGSAMLYRLLPDNSLDASFGAGGAYELPGVRVSALALDANGRLLVAEQDATSTVIARYDLGGAVASTPVVEFYNTKLDHYFITADFSEAAAIDNGSAGSGWARTGNSFKSGGDTAVCRFYGSQSPGPNSHFYTLAGSECDGLKQLQASTPATQQRWNFESLDFISTPASNGTCPGGTTPVYRVYNNGFTRGVDSNHRITSSTAAIQEVVTRGWVNEGVVMCAPN